MISSDIKLKEALRNKLNIFCICEIVLPDGLKINCNYD